MWPEFEILHLKEEIKKLKADCFAAIALKDKEIQQLEKEIRRAYVKGYNMGEEYGG